MRYRFFSLFAIVFIFCGFVLSQGVYALNLDTPESGKPGLDGNRNFIYNLGGLSIGTTTKTANTLLVGTGGIVFSDGSTQTAGFLGSSQTVSAGNVSQGVFGYPSASNAYAFPAALAIGTTTYAGLPTNGLYVAGNVGIGTITPAKRLQVEDIASDAYLRLKSTTGNVFDIGMQTNGVSRVDSSGGSLMIDSISGVNVQTIRSANTILNTAGGNVGVGTTTPSQKLHVLGTIQTGGVGVDGNIYLARSTDGTTNGRIYSSGASSLIFNQSGGLASNLIMGSNGIEFQTEDSTSPYTKVTRMTIRHGDAGNVGIGTTAPDDKLHVVGDAHVTGNAYSSKIVVNPTSGVGWYRISTPGGQGGGSVYIYAFIDNRMERIEFNYNVRSYVSTSAEIGQITVLRSINYNNGPIREIRIGADSTAGNYNTYLDIYVNSATAPAAFTVYGTNGASFLASPIFNPATPTYYKSIDLSTTVYKGIYTTDGVIIGGNVGIATTTPSQALSVQGNILATGNITAGGVISANTSQSQVSGGGGYFGQSTGGASNYEFKSANNVSTTLKIDATNERVGIGTASPIQKLEVNGNVKLSDGADRYIYGPSANYIIMSAGALEFGASSGGNIYLEPAGSIVMRDPDAGYVTKMSWNSSTGNLTLNSGNLTLSSGLITQTGAGNNSFVGNVGIGTTSPGYKLDVVGTSTATTLSLGSNSYVADPIANTSAGTISLNYSTTANNNYGIGLGAIRNSKYDMWFQTGNANGGGYRWYIGTTEKMTMDNIGNVGIGTTAPTQALEVNGVLKVTGTYGLAIGSTSGLNRIQYNTSYFQFMNSGDGYAEIRAGNASFSGSVGIGTTTPASPLTVVGAIRSTTGGFIFPDASTQTTAYLGSSQTVSAGNVSQGVFGYPSASSAYAFPSSLAIGTTTYAGLPANGLYVAGNVGIGTTAPGAKLHIVGPDTDNTDILRILSNSSTRGTFAIRNGSAVNPSFLLGTTGASETLAFMTVGAERIRINATGNVGIGTTNPTDKLYVSYEGTNYEMAATFRNTATTGSVYNGLKFVQGSTESFHLLTTNAATYLRGISNIPMIFYTNNAEKVRITETGSVGIGTTSPQGKLHVKQVAGSANIVLETDDAAPVTGDDLGQIDWYNSSSGGGVRARIIGEADDTWSGGTNFATRLSFWTNNSGTTFAERMRIDKDGNVGIGTTTPAYKLEVLGTLNLPTNNAIRFDNTNNNAPWYIRNSGTGVSTLSFGIGAIQNSNDKIVFSSSGYLGIGTSTPATALHVVGTVTASAFSGGTYAGTIGAANVSNGAFGSNTGGGDYSFPGNVGIGTTTPRGKLDVFGQVVGGFGAVTTGGTLDWNDSSNARPGNGYSLLLGNATNGPDGTSEYYHSLGFEYSSKSGSGNLTQMAIPYTNGSFNWRTRYNAAWGSWRKFWDNGNDGSGSGLDADLLDGHDTSYFQTAGSISGTASYIPKFATASTIGNSIIYDNGTNIGIGNTNPGAKLEVTGDMILTGAVATNRTISVSSVASGVGSDLSIVSGATSAGTQSGGDLNLTGGLAGTGGTAGSVYINGGNMTTGVDGNVILANVAGGVGIGTTTLGAYKLSVDGNIYTNGSMSLYDPTYGTATFDNAGLKTTRSDGLYLQYGMSNGRLTIQPANSVQPEIRFTQVDGANVVSLYRPVGISYLRTSGGFLVDGSVGIGAGALSPDANLVVAPATLTTSANDVVKIGENYTNMNHSLLRLQGSAMTNSGYFLTAYDGNSGAYQFVVRGDGNVGVGTASPLTQFEVYGAYGGVTLTRTSDVAADEPFFLLRKGSTPASLAQMRGIAGGGLRFTNGASNVEWMRFDSTGKLGIGTTNPNGYKVNIAGTLYVSEGTSATDIVADKIDVNTVDPVYTIGGKKYATYLPSMTGVKEETTGVAKLKLNNSRYEYVVDFDKSKISSDLWLFAKATNLENEGLSNLVVLLTPNFDGKAWYQKNKNSIVIYAELSDKQNKNCKAKDKNCSVEVSYRLTAPRFDHSEWSNNASTTWEGLNLDKYLSQ